MASDNPEKPTPTSGYMTGPAGKVFVRDGLAYVRDQKGTLGTVPVAEVGSALASGFSPVEHAEVFEADRIERIRGLPEVGGVEGGLKAFGEGAARSLIDISMLPSRGIAALTGSDQESIPTGGDILSELLGGEVYDERARLRGDEHPILSAAGGIAPDIAALAVTGGGAPLARAAGQGLGRKIAQVAAREGALGALSGASYAGEQAWREGTGVSGDDLLTAMGTGALLSGGLGTAGEAVGAGVRRGADYLTSPAAAKAFSGAMTRGVAGIAGDPLKYSSNPLVRGIGTIVSPFTKAVASTMGRRGGKLGRLASGVDEAGASVDDLLKVEDKAASGLADAVSAETKAADELAGFDAKFESRAAREAANQERQIASLESRALREEAQAQRTFDSAKRRFDKERVAFDRMAVEGAPAIAKAESAVEIARAAERRLAADLAAAEGRRTLGSGLEALEREEASLKARGLRQKAIETGSDMKTAGIQAGKTMARVHTRRAKRVAKVDAEIRALSEQHAAARSALAEKERALAATQEKFALRERAQRETLRSAETELEAARERIRVAQGRRAESAKQARDSFGREKEAARKAAERERSLLLGKVDAAKASASEARRLLGEASQARSTSEAAMADARASVEEGWRRAFPNNVMLIGGRAVERYARTGMRPGALMAAYGVLPSPWQEVEEEAHAIRVSRDNAIAHAAGKTPGVWHPISGVGDYVRYPVGQFQYPGETREQAFRNRQQEIAELAANPELLMGKIGEAAAPIASLSTEASAEVVAASVRAVEWLQKLGRGTKHASDPLRPDYSDVPVSPGEISTYERMWNATMFPGVLLDELATWRINDETVTTMMQVHPDTLDGVRRSVGEAVRSGKMKPSYQQRIQLSALFGIPATGATPDALSRVMMYQQYLEGPGTSGDSGGGKKGRPAGSPTMAQQYRTVSQSVANPGGG